MTVIKPQGLLHAQLFRRFVLLKKCQHAFVFSAKYKQKEIALLQSINPPKSNKNWVSYHFKMLTTLSPINRATLCHDVMLPIATHHLVVLFSRFQEEKK